MIRGIGTDLVDIGRIRRFRERWRERGLRRLFSDDEIAYCLGRADPAPSLAARFAAKEAFFKAVGTGWGRGGDWREVRVRRSASGRPSLELVGRAAAAAEAAGATAFHVSLSHAEEVAGAVVVVES